MAYEDGAWRLHASAMHVFYESKPVWETVTPQDIVGIWKRERRPVPDNTELRLASERPIQYYFYTQAGHMGLLRVRQGGPQSNMLQFDCKRVCQMDVSVQD